MATQTNFNCVSHIQMTVSASSVGITLPTLTVDGVTVNRVPHHALIFVGSNSIRYTCAPGTTPTATLGILVAPNQYINFNDPMGEYSNLIVNFKAIAVTTDAILDIELFN